MNQQDNREEEIKTAPLTDLALDEEQAGKTKAGSGFSAYGGFNGGVFVASGN